MNILLAIIVVSALGAMFLWAMHIDRQRSHWEERKEEESLTVALKRHFSKDKDF